MIFDFKYFSIKIAHTHKPKKLKGALVKKKFCRILFSNFKIACLKAMCNGRSHLNLYAVVVVVVVLKGLLDYPFQIISVFFSFFFFYF